MSIGLLYTLGKFRMLDLADFEWAYEVKLMCPNNPIGTVDVYMTTHHGKKTSGQPAIVQALRPRAAIMNNGPITGASEPAWQAIHTSPGTPDIWQLHYAQKNGKSHNAPAAFIANRREKCAGDWIRLSARADGGFTIQNGRTRKEKVYR